MQQPLIIGTMKDRLWVSDRRYVHIFSFDGTFIESLRPPFRGQCTLVRVSNGWALVSSDFDGVRTILELFDERFENRRLVSEWISDPYDAGRVFNGHTDAWSTPDGTMIILHPEEENDIWIYEVESGNMRVLGLDLVPIPIGDADKEDIAARLNMTRRETKSPLLTADKVPDFYPGIIQARGTLTGKIMLNRGGPLTAAKNPARELYEAGYYKFIDTEGKSLEPTIADLVPAMVFAEDERWIYHSGFDEQQDEFSLYRTEKSEFEHTIHDMLSAYRCDACQ